MLIREWPVRLTAVVALCLGCVLAAHTQSASDLWVTRPGVAKGSVEERTFESKIYGRTRKVWVYRPAGYSRDAKQDYPVLYCFDGDDYIHEMSATTQLDNLIADDKIPAMVAVLIDNSENRLGDLANRQQFADFMANELVPWARKNFRITSDTKKTIVAGSSAGGLASAFMAFAHPELFGNVLAQSGALWRGPEGNSTPYEWLKTQYASAPKKDVRFYIEVGAAETHRALGSGPVFIEATRAFRDALRAKGFEVEYLEVPGAKHEPSHWKTQFGPGLVWLASGWAR